ncbi:MAG: hypothetical protein B7X33_02510 [Lysobacterales bacterium 13-68-4]|nr:MAG: hypothetical protein B7X33_02510 [Xanthomonadales bacterium 13-68-4]
MIRQIQGAGGGMRQIDQARIAIVGLGYVGLPLAVEFGKHFPTVGFDINRARIDELRDATVLELLQRCDGFRRPERIAQMALACECDKRGRLGFEDSDYPQRATLLRLHAAALAINARDLAAEGLSGPAVGEALKRARINAIGAAR